MKENLKIHENLIKIYQNIKNQSLQIYELYLKNTFIDKLDNIVVKQNNPYHGTIKMRTIDVNSSTYIDFDVKVMIKILNLKFGIM